MTNPSDTRDSELVAALKGLIDHVTINECRHEQTHRGGFIWTICDDCGRKWADDLGGFTPYEEPPALTKAYAALKAADTIDRLTSSEEAVLRVPFNWIAVLGDARKAIASLDEGALGYFEKAPHHHWPFRDELLANIDKALADPAASPREGHVEVPVEHGWVLERADSSPAEPWYWAAGQIDPTRSSAWTQNHMAGIRFARREDAEAVSYRLMRKAKIDVRVCAHEWSAETKP